ncbi:MAG: 2-oxoglutarate dehydrogenase complex dihydrolipoyllysine-residue succinyltransferase [Bacteroidales bacterium]|nr:2-oxoglutarate dehydrogenase complex dihydrolipoyllysine-residue succinyltransferase [Bacteroidales bacterium]
MIIEVKVPSPGESISQVQLAHWLTSDGALVNKDEEIAEIDSDKATLTVSAESSGQLKILIAEGETVAVGSVIAHIDTKIQPEKKKPTEPDKDSTPAKKPEVRQPKPEATASRPEPKASQVPGMLHLTPLARKIMETRGVSEEEFVRILKSIRIGKKDVEEILSGKPTYTPEPAVMPAWTGDRGTTRRKMSTLRLKVSERLVAVKNQTAMLTTFNEVNMSPIFNIRKKFKDRFKEKYGVSLGFMSFFTRAVTVALRLFPEVNARIDGDEIIYHDYADIGIAVSSPKGLMVPVLRNAESMTMAEIELQIKELAEKARTNRISIEEMTGGTFTITNGGVFGSMLSTPILNPPQSAILGMHNIVERPIAVSGRVEIHPVMYLALSYDHRIIDGRESVSFLLKIKEMIENPAQLLFDGKDPGAVLTGL